MQRDPGAAGALHRPLVNITAGNTRQMAPSVHTHALLMAGRTCISANHRTLKNHAERTIRAWFGGGGRRRCAAYTIIEGTLCVAVPSWLMGRRSSRSCTCSAQQCGLPEERTSHSGVSWGYLTEVHASKVLCTLVCLCVFQHQKASKRPQLPEERRGYLPAAGKNTPQGSCTLSGFVLMRRCLSGTCPNGGTPIPDVRGGV